MSKTFLSYARGDDEPFVKRLYNDLTSAGFDVWFDRVSMPSRSLTFHQEIRDAIAGRERLILIVGPKAVSSDYVIQEWQFAYFAANKCVNPIVRLDGRDPQGGIMDGYGLIPEDLKLLHAEDFRRDEEYDTHLKNLIRQISEALPPVGKLVAVPELPPGYRAQPERLKALRDLLLLDLQKPVVVTGAAARIGLQGMGGIGKSMLANALAHHPQVQRAFQDGIFWVTLGQQPRIEEIQRQLAVALGGDGQFNSRHEGKEQLRQLLAERAALLILDDVWDRAHADAFNVAGARCRLLLTTRDAGLVTALAARENHYRVELPTLAEAQAILGGAADAPPDQLPPEADDIIHECDRLPLALALCGGMVQGGSSWQNVLAALQEHDLEFLSNEHPGEVQHQNAWNAMDVSLRTLLTEEQQRFAELAVFAADTGAPDAAVATLWEHTGGLSARQTDALLAKFIRRSLVQRPRAADGSAAALIDLHDLLHHFAIGMAIKQLGGLKALHQKVLEAYRRKCPDGWQSGPNDGYYFQSLVHHLAVTGAWPEAEKVATDFSWLMRKCEFNLLDSISSDYALLNQNAETKKRLEIWTDFFREKAHILRRGNEEWPAHRILLQLAVEHADDSPLTMGAEHWLAGNRCNWLWLRRVPRLPHAQKNPCLAVFEGHTDFIKGVLVLTNGRLLTWSQSREERLLRLWDSKSGACLATLDGHTNYINGAFELSGGRLVSWSQDGTLRLWDGCDGTCLATLKGHMCAVEGAKVLVNGKLLSWSQDATLRLWDTDNRVCQAVLEGHTDNVEGALELSDARVLSWSRDMTLRLWDGGNGTCQAVLEGHTETGLCVRTLPNGRLISWSDDRTLRLWDSHTGSRLAVLDWHPNNVFGVLVLRTGLILTWSGTEQTLRVWDSDNAACRAVLEGHTRNILGAVALSDGRLLSWSWDKTLRVWDGKRGACLMVLKGHTYGVSGAIELSSGRLLSWAGDKTLRLWDSSSGTCLAVLEGHTGQVSGALELSNGRLVSFSGDKTMRLWDSSNGRCLAVLVGHSDWVWDPIQLPNGLLLSRSTDKTLRLWDIGDAESLKVLEGHADKVSRLLALPDGRLLSCSKDGTLRLWDSSTGTCMAVLEGWWNWEYLDGALGLVDGRVLCWSSSRLFLWSGRGGGCLANFAGDSNGTDGAMELPSGQLLTWAQDKTLRLWDSQSGTCLAEFTEDQLANQSPEWLLARRENDSGRRWESFRAVSKIGCMPVGLAPRLYHPNGFTLLAIWEADSEASSSCLLLDGTVVLGLDSGQVCILKLHHGNRRISLAEAETLLTEQVIKPEK